MAITIWSSGTSNVARCSGCRFDKRQQILACVDVPGNVSSSLERAIRWVVHAMRVESCVLLYHEHVATVQGD